MKEKVMSAMQAFSKAMFMPVLILPIAGLLIAVGNVGKCFDKCETDGNLTVS